MSPRTKVKLTREQKALVTSAPGVAEKAAFTVLERVGPVGSFEQLVQSGHYGVALAAQSYDAGMGQPFLQWALFRAIHTILDDCRVERRQTMQLDLARIAVIEYLSHVPGIRRAETSYVPDEEGLRTRLDRYKAGVIGAFLEGLASVPAMTGGEDEVIEREDAILAARAIRQVHDELQPEQRALLRLKTDKELQDAAAAHTAAGNPVSFWTLARQRGELREIVGARIAARLSARGIRDVPARLAEAWDVLNANDER